jgi:hypothetical protein
MPVHAGTDETEKKGEEKRMALEWNVTKVANYTESFPDAGTKDDPQWNATTLALVWLAIPCAWGWGITEENYREVFTRISMYETVRGAFRSKEGADGKAEEVFMTLAEVKGHIGMTVNVSAKTKQRFHADLARMIRQDAEGELKRQEKEIVKVVA